MFQGIEPPKMDDVASLNARLWRHSIRFDGLHKHLDQSAAETNLFAFGNRPVQELAKINRVGPQQRLGRQFIKKIVYSKDEDGLIPMRHLACKKQHVC